jgi:peptide/nickel transport system substrate-binding protein
MGTMRRGVALNRAIRVIAVVAVLGMVAAACGNNKAGDTPTPSGGTANLEGGTLHMAMLADVTAAFDPQKEYYSVTWEYYRCCLLRTLMSYEGTPTDEGGATIHPDLASDATQSSDGLTWTFSIKPGLMYAPPMDKTEITAGDFIRAIERTANPKANVGGYSFYYSVIEGFDDFAAGKADTISGMTAPDDHTLEITTTTPVGDVSYRFAMGTTAPIPPDAEGEKMGTAEGHDRNYGRFLVASGPYMFEGSETMDFSADPKDQTEAPGYVPGRQIVLVRNPSWTRESDQLRDAYPEKIEVRIGGDNDDLYNQVAQGALDFVVDGAVPPEKIRDYQTNPDLQDRINIYASDAVRYVSFNLAVPPFDDIHVRKAVNWAFDKQGFRQLRGGPSVGEIAGHIMVNSLEDNILSTYDPYQTANASGDVAKAKEEMKQSAYDANQDGVCDAPECKDILTITDREDPYSEQMALLKQFLEPIGLTLDDKQLERGTMYNKCNDANSHHALCAGPGWGKDYADGVTFGEPLFSSAGLWESCCNYSLLGATADQLKGWGYSVTSVPSVDDKEKECSGLEPGDARFKCWAELDQDLMENVVPWVPYLFDNSVDILSDNVKNYSFDQFAGLAAFDSMAVPGNTA